MITLTKICEDAYLTEYRVNLDKEYTVREFINWVILKKYEYLGFIGIKDKNSTSPYGNPYCSYNKGKQETDLPDEIMCQKIVSVNARGGWSRMDFLITLQERIKVMIPGCFNVTLSDNEQNNQDPGKHIDWEQRTWVAAKDLFTHSDTITADQAVKAAQDLVNVYRELSNDLKIKEQ